MQSTKLFFTKNTASHFGGWLFVMENEPSYLIAQKTMARSSYPEPEKVSVLSRRHDIVFVE